MKMSDFYSKELLEKSKETAEKLQREAEQELLQVIGKTTEVLKAYYTAIVNTTGNSYEQEKYRFQLGFSLYDVIGYMRTEPYEAFGIRIERDEENPFTIKVFKDITSELEEKMGGE
jgi:hypothetical protein